MLPQRIVRMVNEHTHRRTLEDIFENMIVLTGEPIHHPSNPLRQHYDRLLEGGTPPSLARVTMARKIASITLALWKKEEPYRAAYDRPAEEIPHGK